ncbi:UMP kinase [Candidatus Woesearchaeota archaeon]|nr:UMP kinase [Candidatus Woesearchaeota archaeon]
MGKRGAETVVISLGGSVLVPSAIDAGFLMAFRKLILRFAKEGKKFVIICGGGQTARSYQKAAAGVVQLGKDDSDWLGIHATRLNAQLLRDVLSDVAHKRVVKNPNEKSAFRESVLIAAGWKPGRSTDYVAAVLARTYGVRTIINVTNKDYVYDRNPDEHDNAKPLRRITWQEFRSMFGAEWSPGLNVPFDPVASRAAHDAKIRVVVLGRDLRNLEGFLLGKPFKGTVIEDGE